VGRSRERAQRQHRERRQPRRHETQITDRNAPARESVESAIHGGVANYTVPFAPIDALTHRSQEDSKSCIRELMPRTDNM
jgi:hypothetical protein